jgi:very-short-patch-repair endonuclease
MREKLGPADAALATAACRQHGVVTTAQIAAAGIDKSGLGRRVRAGRLHPIHRGVYAVGHAGLSQEGVWVAAVLACGDGAVLSHASAAALWGLLRPIQGPVHVSLRSRSGHAQRSGIRIHRPRSLTPADLTRRSNIPVTSVSRTLLDLDGSVEPNLYRRAVREAQHRRHRLDPRIRADRTRSDLEVEFLAFCRRRQIPAPEVNLALGPRLTVDFVWPASRLAVETDSYEYHHGEEAFEDDRARDLRIRGRGYEVLRYTGRQLEDPRQAPLIAAEILARLSP